MRIEEDDKTDREFAGHVARDRATNRHKNTKERVVIAAYSRCQEHTGIALR
jgi:hypothetical protein